MNFAEARKVFGSEDIEESRSWLGYIDESSLSRVWRLMEKPFAILTAFRGQLDLKTNQKRNRELLSALNGMGMGPHLLIGHWQEAPDGFAVTGSGNSLVIVTPDGQRLPLAKAVSDGIVQDVTEESFFVPIPADMTYIEFVETITKFVKKYKQDAAILGDGENMYFLTRSGRLTKFASTAAFGKIAQAYSQLRKKPGVPFVFEGVTQPQGVISRMAFAFLGLHYIHDM